MTILYSFMCFISFAAKYAKRYTAQLYEGVVKGRETHVLYAFAGGIIIGVIGGQTKSSATQIGGGNMSWS